MKNQFLEFSQSRQTNAAHLAFNTEVKNAVANFGAEKVNCTTELSLYATALEQEVHIVNRQQGSSITPELDAIDRERCDSTVYVFSLFDAAEYSPVATDKEAYAQLLPTIKPFRGLTGHSHAQKTAEIIALIADLRTPEAKKHVQK